MMIHRRNKYRRYRRGNVIRSNFRYTPLCYYSHRYRNVFAFVSTAGFYNSLEAEVDTTKCSGNQIKTGQVCKINKVDAYFNETQEFSTFFPDMYAPTTKSSANPPYFTSADELVTLLGRYTKYKLVSVKHYASNFKFLEIIVRCKKGTLTQDERLNCQKYFIQKYSGIGNDDYGSKFVLDYDKFDVHYQWVPTLSIEKVYRNHTVLSDSSMNTKDIAVTSGDAPVKIKKLYNNSVMREVYYPRASVYLNSNEFFGNKFADGDFKKWMDSQHVTNYPNYTFFRICLGPEQYVNKDINSCQFNVIFCDISTYYRFKFAGINNLDVQ